MKRLGKIALVTLLSCLLLPLVAWGIWEVCLSYTAAKDRRADSESRVRALEQAAHPRWHVREGRFSISTTDRPENSERFDLRLPYGANAVQTFDKVIWKESGEIVTAWVSDWSPRSEMAKFEKFSVSPLRGARFQINAQARANESVAMEFTVTFIVQDDH